MGLLYDYHVIWTLGLFKITLGSLDISEIIKS
jgi:hypothetical protein